MTDKEFNLTLTRAQAYVDTLPAPKQALVKIWGTALRMQDIAKTVNNLERVKGARESGTLSAELNESLN